VGAVVALGCEVPVQVSVTRVGGRLAVQPVPTGSSPLECFVAMTSVALVLVDERSWVAGAPAAPPTRTVSEYLLAREGPAWRVADRRPGGTFDDEQAQAVAAGFDAPLRLGRSP